MATPKARARPAELSPPITMIAGTGQNLLTLDDLVELTGTPKSTLYSLFAEGKGPRRMKLGRALRFRPTDVDAWLDAMVAGNERRAA